MKILKVRWLFFILATLSFLTNEFLQSQTKPLPIVVTCRKSLLGGSYVLQLQNTSIEQLNIWLDAREKIATFLIPAGKMKEVGWAQGFRFDANDLFFIGADGYDTIRQSMPNNELSSIRVGFSKDGGLTINLSQSFLQYLLPKIFELPIKITSSNVLEVSINDMPQIILEDMSDKIYANVVIQVIPFSSKVHIPINTSVSFVPFYIPSTGVLGVSQIKVENIDIVALPKEWLEEVTKIINNLIPIWFSKLEIYQLDKTVLKYCKFFSVRQISIHNRRLEIILL
ncbi:MAG: hypothetical protein ABR936_15185 [Bacteroidota bacterium]|jgi:hypothetical protein